VTKKTEIPDWETLLAHAALPQAKIPAAILVGGTAAAVHAGLRISFDHDHVVKDLAKNQGQSRVSARRRTPSSAQQKSLRR
jgi:mitochondrial fission protein ELM1